MKLRSTWHDSRSKFKSDGLFWNEFVIQYLTHICGLFRDTVRHDQPQTPSLFCRGMRISRRTSTSTIILTTKHVHCAVNRNKSRWILNGSRWVYVTYNLRRDSAFWLLLGLNKHNRHPRRTVKRVLLKVRTVKWTLYSCTFSIQDWWMVFFV